VNVGPHDDADRMGERTYGVRINEQVITPLRHRRSDGLGRCLLAASKAVEKQKWMDVEVFPSGNDPDDNAGGKVRRTRKPSGLQNAWRRMVEDEPRQFLRVVSRFGSLDRHAQRLARVVQHMRVNCHGADVSRSRAGVPADVHRASVSPPKDEVSMRDNGPFPPPTHKTGGPQIKLNDRLERMSK